MRKAILIKFIQVLLSALVLNSVIFYIVTSSVMLKNSRQDMLYNLQTIDDVLDYTGDLAGEVRQLDRVTDKNNSRFTLIKMDGSVAADTGFVDPAELDNHLEREEVADAMRYGQGDSRRYSKTVHKTMLYVAVKSEHNDMILRLAVPFSGLREYLIMLLPAVWLSFLVALLVSVGVADKFAESISKPLREISREMIKVNGDYGDLHFEEYQYPEINIIAETTTKMSQNVKEYLTQIEHEKQIRQEFFSNASHELKTPITSIQGYAELLESGMIRDEATRLDFLQRIRKEAVSMTSLINDILMISRLETKEAEVVKSEVRLSLIADDLYQALKPMAAGQEVMIHIDCQPVSIWANAQQMTELLGNLMSNAIKYNHPGGQVWVRIRQTGAELKITVTDDGVGIPKDSLDRIFERFYRVDKGRSRKQGGTGLGLSIVKHIVGFYGGTITVESELEKGTTFTVTLPVQNE